MRKKTITLLGGGGQAKVLLGVLQTLHASYKIEGFLDDNQGITELDVHIKNLGKLTEPPDFLAKQNVVLGLGHLGKVDFYKKIIKTYEDLDCHFESVLASTASISSLRTYFDKAVIIAEGAIIQPCVTLGRFTIINTKASVDHDCKIGSYVHIAPGSTLSGGVTVGNNCLLGTGYSVIQGITIVDDCIIGAGAVVVKDCTEPGTYVGVPARKIK